MFSEVRVENVSQKRISIIDLKLLSYIITAVKDFIVKALDWMERTLFK